MLRMYSDYWKNTFNYKTRSNVKDLMCAAFFNLLILMGINLIGLLGPISLENIIVNLFYLTLLIMLFPTVSLLIRVFKS
ncbi:hypothetical protein IGI95_002672 [Enterococcus sp. DIV0784]|uniref:hypothetical protein n=1 Tax=unclassified Enterococcus TaxID=2608891 RepID=UPI003F25CF23